MDSAQLDGYLSLLAIRQKGIRRNLIISEIVYAAMVLVPMYLVLTRYDEWIGIFIFVTTLSSVSTILTNARMEQVLIKSQIELLQELRQMRRDS